MDAPVSSILRVLERGEGGPRNTKCEVFQHPSSQIALLWIAVKLPIVTDREFVVCQWVPEQKGADATVVRVSLPDDITFELRPASKKHVRGIIHTQSTWLTPHPTEPGCTIVKCVGAAEPGGEPCVQPPSRSPDYCARLVFC